MKLPKYVTATKRYGEDALHTSIIIRLERPRLVGYPYCVEGPTEEQRASMNEAVEQGKAAKVQGYSIWITCCARLDHGITQDEERASVLNDMAMVFLTECIEPHEKRFKQYREL